MFLTRGSRRTEESSFSQGWSFPPTSSESRPRQGGKSRAADKCPPGAVPGRPTLLAGTEVRKGECPVDYRFITTCGKCGREFVVFWVMNRSLVGPESVANMTCPVCGRRVNQSARELLPYEARGGGLFGGRPVRTVELAYDCPYCGKKGIFESLMHTDLPWEDLSKEADQFAVCNSAPCPQRGLPQKLKPTRIQSGALNPSWE